MEKLKLKIYAGQAFTRYGKWVCVECIAARKEDLPNDSYWRGWKVKEKITRESHADAYKKYQLELNKFDSLYFKWA